jgi:hypothetical protein
LFKINHDKTKENSFKESVNKPLEIVEQLKEALDKKFGVKKSKLSSF